MKTHQGIIHHIHIWKDTGSFILNIAHLNIVLELHVTPDLLHILLCGSHHIETQILSENITRSKVSVGYIQSVAMGIHLGVHQKYNHPVCLSDV